MRKMIDGAVVAGPGKDMWKPEPMVAMTSDEILAAAGTKYTFSPNVLTLKEAVRQYGLEKVGTVAIPCQTMGIRKIQSYPFGVRFVSDKIALIYRYILYGKLPIRISTNIHLRENGN